MDEIFHLAKILPKKKIKSSFWLVEKKLIKKHKNILAIDEAGRGALAGPLCLGALFLDKISLKILEKRRIYFYDSKILKPEEREIFRKIIRKLGLVHKTILISNKRIDKIGINKAFIYGVKKLIDYFGPEALIIDGLKIKLNFRNFYSFIGGGQRLSSLGAASILAKTYRDKYMIKISKKYPFYSFDRHKGYGTYYHFQKLKELGLSKIHRQSFLKNFL